jgi:NTP pyrophosphatase (non-canonical NTP hydrolase)
MSGFPTAVVTLLRERSIDRCEMCGGRATNSHHRRPRGLGGSRDPKTDAASNGVRICGSGTTGCHGWVEGNRETARELGWLVRQGQDPAEVPILLMRPAGVLEWVLLDDEGAAIPCCPCGTTLADDAASPALAHLLLHQPSRAEFVCRRALPVPVGTPAAEVAVIARDLGVPVGTGVQVEVRHHGTPVDWAMVSAADEVEAWLPALRPRPDGPAPRKQQCQVAHLVREFHGRMGCRIDQPWSDRLVAERVRLITEECREAHEALWSGDLLAIAKELADLVYVTYGAAINLGIDLDLAVALVHASNMSKLGDDGRPIYDTAGKVLKGPNYRPPDMTPALPSERAAREPQAADSQASHEESTP